MVEYLKITKENQDLLLKNKELLKQMYESYNTYFGSYRIYDYNFKTFCAETKAILNKKQNMFYLTVDKNKLLAGVNITIIPHQSIPLKKEALVSFIFTNPKYEKQNFGLKTLLYTLADLRVNQKDVLLLSCHAENIITNSIFKRAVGKKKIKIPIGNKEGYNLIQKVLRKVGKSNPVVYYRGVDLNAYNPEIHINRKPKPKIKNKTIKKSLLRIRPK